MTRITARPLAPSPPTGEQFEIRAGGHGAVIAAVGATLRSYRVDGHDVIDGFSIDETSSAGRGQVLAPWPNRLEDGTYEFDGRQGVAALDEPEHSNAIHGLVRWLVWHPVARSADGVTLGCVAARAARLPVADRPRGGVPGVPRWPRGHHGGDEPFGIDGAVRHRVPSIPHGRDHLDRRGAPHHPGTPTARDRPAGPPGGRCIRDRDRSSTSPTRRSSARLGSIPRSPN